MVGNAYPFMPDDRIAAGYAAMYCRTTFNWAYPKDKWARIERNPRTGTFCVSLYEAPSDGFRSGLARVPCFMTIDEARTAAREWTEVVDDGVKGEK